MRKSNRNADIGQEIRNLSARGGEDGGKSKEYQTEKIQLKKQERHQGKGRTGRAEAETGADKRAGKVKKMKNKKEPVWIEMKILTPLSGDFFPKEGFGWEEELDGGEELWDGRDLMQYMESIQEAVDRENSPEEEGGAPCNLMEYFHGSASIKEKVESAVVSVESAEGVLYGCTTLRLKGNLEPEELHELCEYITGQYSDGWGEGFEQRDIQVDGGTLNVHFWQKNGMEYQIQAAEEKKPGPGNEKTADPGSHAKKIRPRLQLIGHEGNIFSIVADAGRLLSRNGQRKEADEMYDRVFKAGSYHEALGIISEYVETELSDAREKKNQRKQKTEKAPCR